MMGEVVAFKRPEKPPIDGPNVVARTLFWLAVYAAGMFGVAFGMGYSLPQLIHECAPPKPFIEKWSGKTPPLEAGLRPFAEAAGEMALPTPALLRARALLSPASEGKTDG